MKQHQPFSLQRGISLIEAVVALAVMAFGLVAIVGVQGTLRSNADISKQRSEAVRIAQERVERWRAFTSLPANAAGAPPGFGNIVTELPFDVPGQNATYVVTTTVPAVQAPEPRTLTVTVAWNDRSGTDTNNPNQQISLTTAIAGIAPELAGSLSLPTNSGAIRRVDGRNPVIPQSATKFTDGTSGFVPPQTGGPKVAWVFSNVTGLIESTCTVPDTTTSATLTLAVLAAANCDSTRTAQLVSGFVNFADLSAQPTEAEAEAPSGLPLNLNMSLTLTSANHPTPGWECFDDSPEVATSSARPVAYFCAIYSNPQRNWAGRLRVGLLPFTTAGSPVWVIGMTGTNPNERLICRYTTLATDGGSNDKNSAHPLDYRLDGMLPGTGLRDQNFLVIRGIDTCPVDPAPDDDPVNSSTRLHQSGLAPYT